jgi:hypothetical protein
LRGSPPPTEPWAWRTLTTRVALDDHEPGLRLPAPGDGWARNAVTAAGIAADRAELWVPGGLASAAFLGWVPFLLAVTSLPTPGDLAFFGAGLATSASYPLNIVLLVGSAGLVLVAASILVASGEAALQRAIDRVLHRDLPVRSLDDAAARLWLIQLVAALPTLAALGLTALGIVSVAPGEYQSPDIGGPLLVRIARDVWPLLAVAAAAAVVGVAFGAAAQRAAVGLPRRSLAAAIAVGAAAVIRQPVRRLGLAIATLAVLAAWLAATWFLLALLWRPIGRSMAGGHLGEAWMPLLLVGFVAIWLCLVAAGGALHGWASAWWSLELADLGPRRPDAPDLPSEETDRRWT